MPLTSGLVVKQMIHPTTADASMQMSDYKAGFQAPPASQPVMRE